MEELNKQLDAASVSPGTHESSLFDKMIQIIINESENYDYLIFDTAPTGHTLRLLSLPEMLGAWMESLIKKRNKTISLRKMAGKEMEEEDPIIKILTRRKDNLEIARKIMIEENRLTFAFEETKKAVSALRKYGINVDTLVVNKILPENSTDEFWINKKNDEERYLKIIENEIPVKNIYKVPLFRFDMDEININEMVKIFG
jgi:arsenite-transporting ATPase